MDGDGGVDIAISQWYAQNPCIEWYENPPPRGSPVSDPWKRHIIGPLRAHDLKVGDIDGDGLLEIATRNQGKNGNSMVIWKRDAAGSWNNRVLQCPAGEGLALGDINRNGRHRRQESSQTAVDQRLHEPDK